MIIGPIHEFIYCIDNCLSFTSGLGDLRSRRIEHIKTEERDGQLYMIFNVLRVARLCSSIISDEIERIGQFTTIERKVRLNADTKRLWFQKLKNINDKIMIISFPIILPKVLPKHI